MSSPSPPSPPPRRVSSRKRRAPAPAPAPATASTANAADPAASSSSSRAKRPKRSKPKASSSSSSAVPSTSSKPSTSKAKPASESPLEWYTPTRQTLFLADNNLTVTFKPVQAKQSGGVSLLRCFGPFKDDVHGYFVSPKAAKNAATAVGAISIYRHIGHVTLRKFQQLDNLPPQRQWFPSVKKTSAEVINLRIPLQTCWCENDEAAIALESLSSVADSPWPKPFIVALAQRDDILRACDVDNYDEDFDLEVQVYAGRLLFELIASPDIRMLFTHLISPIPYKPVPTVKEYPVVFQRSPPIDDRFHNWMFFNLLRNAESTGYADLTKGQSRKIEAGISVKLYDYQRQTVRWMIDKEVGPYSLNDYFWEERSFTGAPGKDSGKYYYFPMTGEVRLCKPPSTRGGMVTEEMGLGKTVEALALIVSQKSDVHKPTVLTVHCEKDPPDLHVFDRTVHMMRTRIQNHERAFESVSSIFQHHDEILEDPDEIEFPAHIKVRRWPAKTTLIVCPRSLLGQWKHEIQTRAPSLTWAEWAYPEYRAVKYAVGPDARDVMFATYDMVRSYSEISKVSWKRLILDEAQLTRRSSTQIAMDVFNLRSEYRFLMTGTPIVNCIGDLKGQLSFLKIWPFTLESDGFWEQYVMRRSHNSERLLNGLLKVTMVRHSKGQNLNLTLPQRTYETVMVNLAGSYRACYYYVLASCLDEIQDQNQNRSETRLRTLLRLLLALCLSPYLLDAVSLDLSRRLTWSRWATAATSSVGIQKMSSQEAIQFVAESGNGVLVDSQRVFAVRGRDSDNLYEMYMQMPMNELREYVIERSLLPVNRASRTPRERLAALAAGGAYRLETDTLKDLRNTANEVKLASRADINAWPRAKIIARLRQHYDLQNGIQALRTVHESGFAAIMRIAEKRGNPSCPVCLCECEGRITVTKCGHLYCFECLMLLLQATEDSRRCAICRRPIAANLTVEIERPVKNEKEKQAKKETDGSASEDGSDLKKEEVVTAASAADQEAKTDNPGPSSSNLQLSAQSSEESDDQSDFSGVTAQTMWATFEACRPPPSRFNTIGRNELFPSLSANFLRHLAAVRSGSVGSPKLNALLNLIKSSSDDTKFCVVAGSIESLRVIFRFLQCEGIECVGAGVRKREGGVSEWAPNTARTMMEGAERFVSDPKARVFLLNPSNAAGLTLTAANVIVFMEVLERAADEVQAAGRVHRIGQTKNVRVVRIVARNTLEEKIVDQRGDLNNYDERSGEMREQMQESTTRLLQRMFRNIRGTGVSHNHNNNSNLNNNDTLTWGVDGADDDDNSVAPEWSSSSESDL